MSRGPRQRAHALWSRGARVLAFPHSRRVPAGKGFVDLGLSQMARRIRGVQPGLHGHWCSRCKGIWYGYVGECECPVCGNRNG